MRSGLIVAISLLSLDHGGLDAVICTHTQTQTLLFYLKQFFVTGKRGFHFFTSQSYFSSVRRQDKEGLFEEQKQADSNRIQ